MAYYRLIEKTTMGENPMYKIEWRHSPMGPWTFVDDSCTFEKEKALKMFDFLLNNNRITITDSIVILEQNNEDTNV